MPPFLASVLEWLRAGYPEGVPEHDYLPLFALLRRKLTEDEVITIAEALSANGDPTSILAIRTAIAEVTQQAPLDGDMTRVSARLAAGGWPLADPARTAPDAS